MDARPTAMSDHRGPSRAPVLFAVDDDLATLDLLREIAREAGWTVHGFTRLGELRASLDRQRPNLLILDDDLPDGRGGDLARELREDARMTDVPLVVCTAAHPMRAGRHRPLGTGHLQAVRPRTRSRRFLASRRVATSRPATRTSGPGRLGACAPSS